MFLPNLKKFLPTQQVLLEVVVIILAALGFLYFYRTSLLLLLLFSIRKFSVVGYKSKISLAFAAACGCWLLLLGVAFNAGIPVDKLISIQCPNGKFAAEQEESNLKVPVMSTF